MAYGSAPMMNSKPKMNKPKPKMDKPKPKKNDTSNDKGKKGEISQKEMARPIQHSTKHGGMKSKHMRNMIKMMKQGMSFAMSHKKAMELDKK